MVLYTIKFNGDQPDEEVRAASYGLTHDGHILAFRDDHGTEVWACPLTRAACWSPYLKSPADLRVPVSLPGAGTSHLGETRTSIEAQVRGAMGSPGMQGNLVVSA